MDQTLSVISLISVMQMCTLIFFSYCRNLFLLFYFVKHYKVFTTKPSSTENFHPKKLLPKTTDLFVPQLGTAD